MEYKLRDATGLVTLVLSVPAIAQEVTSAKVSVPTNCASCGERTDNVTVPGGPVLLVAFAIGLVAGVLIGLMVARAKSTPGR